MLISFGLAINKRFVENMRFLKAYSDFVGKIGSKGDREDSQLERKKGGLYGEGIALPEMQICTRLGAVR